MEPPNQRQALENPDEEFSDDAMELSELLNEFLAPSSGAASIVDNAQFREAEARLVLPEFWRARDRLDTDEVLTTAKYSIPVLRNAPSTLDAALKTPLFIFAPPRTTSKAAPKINSSNADIAYVVGSRTSGTVLPVLVDEQEVLMFRVTGTVFPAEDKGKKEKRLGGIIAWRLPAGCEAILFWVILRAAPTLGPVLNLSPQLMSTPPRLQPLQSAYIGIAPPPGAVAEVRQPEGVIRVEQGVVVAKRPRMEVHGRGQRTIIWNHPEYPIYVVGAIFATEGFVKYSDPRLKDKIQDILAPYAMNVLEALRSVSYVFKDDPTQRRRIGYLADQLRDLVPPAVTEDPSTGYYTVDLEQVLPVVSSAVQELIRRNATMQRQLHDMEQKFAALHVSQNNASTPSAEDLRKRAQDAYQQKSYEEAVTLFSSAAALAPTDARIYSGRAGCHVRLGRYTDALEDARSALARDPKYGNAHFWKALALRNLQYPEFAYTSVATVAAHYQPRVTAYDGWNLVRPSGSLKSMLIPANSRESHLMELLLQVGADVVFIVEGGTHKVAHIAIEYLRIIGVGNVHLMHAAHEACNKLATLTVFPSKVYLDNLTLTSDAGNVLLVKAGEVIVRDCIFSPTISPPTNFPLVAVSGGCVRLVRCVIRKSGGGGVLCKSEQLEASVSIEENCVIEDCKNPGLEVRQGGRVSVKDTVIQRNSNGILCWQGAGGLTVTNCDVRNNLRAGVLAECWTTGRLCICDSRLYQNNQFGISLDAPIGATGKESGDHYEVRFRPTTPAPRQPPPNRTADLVRISGNRIFENFYWGLNVKSKVCALIEGNKFFANWCGGLRVGHNYSAVLIIRGNRMEFNGGPGYWNECRDGLPIIPALADREGIPADETRVHTREPAMHDNVISNQPDYWQFDGHALGPLERCAWCAAKNQTAYLCPQCHAIAYCDDVCAQLHARVHRPVCNMAVNLRHRAVITPPPKNNFMLADLERLLGLDPRLGEPPSGTQPPRIGHPFLVKVCTNNLTSDPGQELLLYDATRTVFFKFVDSAVYYLIRRHGRTSVAQFTEKEAYVWAELLPTTGQVVLLTSCLSSNSNW